MRLNQIVQWTLLPHRLTDDGFLAASIFVSPRLRADGPATLADFPDFADWPSQGAQLLIQREDGTTSVPRQVLNGGDSRLWQALFPPETQVKPFVFDDYADRPIVSYPVLGVLDHLKERWSSLALLSPDELPLTNRNASPIGPPIDMGTYEKPVLGSHFGDLRDVLKQGIFEGLGQPTGGRPGEGPIDRQTDEERFSERLESLLDGAATASANLRAQHNLTRQPLIQPFGGSANARDSFYSLIGFHRRPTKTPAQFPVGPNEVVAEITSLMEFHHLVSSLGDHPDLLRRLGLVIDVIIQPDFVPVITDQDPPTKYRVLVERQSAFPPRQDPQQTPWNVDVMPWTLTRFTSVDGLLCFAPAERPSASRRFVPGFLHLDPLSFSAVTVDVDGLALKALNMAATLNVQDMQEQRPVEEPGQAGVPSPRTGGVALVHSGHADELHSDFYAARGNDDALENLDPDNPPVLAAEDLVRGYRMDVFDGWRGSWHSLYERNAKYTPLRDAEATMEVADEGLTQLSLSGEVDRPGAPVDPNGAVYAHEALLTWDGWSLAARRPESSVQQEPAPPEAQANQAPLNLDISIAARPGSLPTLRFGKPLRLRARTVDLAGNALSLEQANNFQGFFEGTGNPDYVVALPSEPLTYRRFEPVGAPELVPRRRFGPGEGLERLVIRSNFDRSASQYAEESQAAANAMFRYVPFCDRHVAPPKASLELVERHSMLDEALQAVQGLSPNEAAAAIQGFYDIAKRESGSFRERPDADFVETGRHDDKPQGYVVVDADDVELPYLPDPFAGGFVMRIESDPSQPAVDHVHQFRSTGGWHELLPVRIHLIDDGGFSAGFVDPGHREFAISVPAGRTARIRINSVLNQDPELFGLLEWCREKLHADDYERLLGIVKENRHWMFTPWRTVNLIHAVQQPVLAPDWQLDIETPVFSRRQGESAAVLSGRIGLDLPSTARVDLIADWDDVVDDPKLPLDPDNLIRKMHAAVFSFAVPEPFGTQWSSSIQPVLVRDDEQNMRFRTESGEQETIEVFRRRLLRDAATPGLSVQQRNGYASAAAHIEDMRSHDFGDTKYRRVTYQMTASTRFREYFDPATSVELFQQRGNTQTLEMLSSAPPPVPSVIDVVPIFNLHQEGELATGITSARKSMGLRVWLKRPWFTSGAGELLGVLCCSDGILGFNSTDYREVSYIGRDPAHLGSFPLPLGVNAFRSVVRRVESVSFKTELGVASRPLAAFQPKYDRISDAWYCDIEFETGTAYFPFVRLGLVRYQPNSIEGCEVSLPAPTYFVQTLPGRALTVTVPVGGPMSIRMVGPAPSTRINAALAVVPTTNLAVAQIEEQDPLVQDPALGWTGVGQELELGAQVIGDGTVVWSGELPPIGAGAKRRLRVSEYELHPSDNRTGAGAPYVDTRRLVYSDFIELT